MNAVCNATCIAVLSALAIGRAQAQATQPSVTRFKHIVIVIQENRTPDDLFQGLCRPPYGRRGACGRRADQYDIRDYGIDSAGTRISLGEVRLGNSYNPGHSHRDFSLMCDLDPATNRCKMDGLVATNCPKSCSFEFVTPADVHQYLELAQQYGWANSMFQTNQGPSAPAHQFLFGGTSAPSLSDDAQARFVAENPNNYGCLSPLNAVFELIDPQHLDEFELVNNPLGTVCFTNPTLAALLEHHSPPISWKYYTAGSGLWTAPNWNREICQPDSEYKECTGPKWMRNVDQVPSDVLSDIANCKLPHVSWVTPIGQNSDHPSSPGSTGGPAWVAAIVNAIGNSWTNSGHRCDYWGTASNDSTAVIITWDDWGGFYDHRAPHLLSAPGEGQGDYQYGFRVPLIVVSAYTNAKIDSANRYDFGSILRFVEQNYGIAQGAIGTADARSHTDLTDFFNLKQQPRIFSPVKSPVPASFFINDKRPMEPPDDD